ncbi:MAG: hypothetical protein ABIL09_11045 [Gemmatimonadota bacterium]
MRAQEITAVRERLRRVPATLYQADCHLEMVVRYGWTIGDRDPGQDAVDALTDAIDELESIREDLVG